MNTALNAENIRLLNWNIYKGQRLGWQDDLRVFSAESDLLLMQEAVLHHDMLQMLGETFYYGFSRGYSGRKHSSGVLTAAKAKPLRSTGFQVREPLLRTPKAVLVTEYALNDHDQTLLVVNIHAVNFTLGTGFFRAQLFSLHELIKEHQGPVIFSGDFNTWRRQRLTILLNFIDSLGLQAVDFTPNSRKAFWGQPLDYVFYRGLHARLSMAVAVASSDHNPLLVSLTLQ